METDPDMETSIDADARSGAKRADPRESKEITGLLGAACAMPILCAGAAKPVNAWSSSSVN
ncbi:hypothetical protein [Rhodoblastus sp.]|uniref:hypothetical protein n=1 Tax=Rhodoblastus sp. TaxID=1962975 RepID=UPI003F964291